MVTLPEGPALPGSANAANVGPPHIVAPHPNPQVGSAAAYPQVPRAAPTATLQVPADVASGVLPGIAAGASVGLAQLGGA